MKRADTSAPTVNGLDEMRVMIYSAGWQMLEERVDTGWSSGFAADKIYQTIYGLRYIDDVICRRLDGNHDGDYTDSGDGDKTFYHLTDNQFSTVAVVDENSGLLERVSYDPYGRARHHWMADVDGDGDQDSGDINTIYTLGPGGFGSSSTPITASGYNVDCDIDRDGDIDNGDYTKANGDGTRSALDSGVLSNIGNVLGFSGYIFNAEIGAGVYTVRFRHYDVGLGRWLERDPLEYVDGMTLYGYVSGAPLGAMDPYGLREGDGAAPIAPPGMGIGDAVIRPSDSRYAIYDAILRATPVRGVEAIPIGFWGSKHGLAIEQMLAGFADSWTLGLTRYLRETYPPYEGVEPVDTTTAYYQASYWTTAIAQMLLTLRASPVIWGRAVSFADDIGRAGLTPAVLVYWYRYHLGARGIYLFVTWGHRYREFTILILFVLAELYGPDYQEAPGGDPMDPQNIAWVIGNVVDWAEDLWDQASGCPQH